MMDAGHKEMHQRGVVSIRSAPSDSSIFPAMLLAWKSAALRSFKVNVPLLRTLKVESGGAWGAQRAGIASVLGTAATNRAGMVVPGPSWSKHLDAHLMGVRSDGVRRLTSSTGLSNEEVEPPRVSCALPFLSSF
jgi:hypothetical protein